MNYEGQICRAPMEHSSFMLPVTVGCPYNQCKFCNLFRHLRYRELPAEKIEEELKRVKDIGGSPTKIFLGDGNAFGLKTERLFWILERIQSYFPDCRTINMDATVTSILQKSEQELKRLAEYGVRHLYLGIESGLEDVLTFMKKDHTVSEAYEAIERLQAAGLIYDAHIMTGVAGRGRGRENADALAQFLNQTHPAHVVNFSMFIHREVPLYREIENGNYVPADELESLREEKRLLEQLNIPVKYEGFHDYLQIRVRGKLPSDQEKMVGKLETFIKKYEAKPPIYTLVQGECPDLVKCDNLENVWANT
jgi:radical SAM superfamily enzyme YgiQ (UPF0313 family)